MPSTIAPKQQQSPRGPRNELHDAACQGSTVRTTALLSRGSINIDQGDPEGITPLMYAAKQGFSHITRILLKKGADLSIAMEDGCSALHISAQFGHLAVTADLVKAGADLESRNVEGDTPGHLAAYYGHSKVVTALIEAGADVDSRGMAGGTPLIAAASEGHVDVVRKLLRAKANPLLGTKGSPRLTYWPLDVAAQNGHWKVVHELIQQRGIEGCTVGASGGVEALSMAAQNQRVDTMVMLMDAGVVDTGLALIFAARWGGEAAVKLLLQQRQLARSPTCLARYVNTCDGYGCTALFRSIDSCVDASGAPRLSLPRVVRLLVDAGADTTSAVRVANGAGGVSNYGTPLAYTNKCLRKKKVRGVDLTEEQLHRLEAIRRLLLRVEAVYAVSWLWPSEVPFIADAAGGTSRTQASSTQLALMLPIPRRRRRGALLVPLLRYSSYP